MLVGRCDAATADEALRGALGLTLRGAHVHVVLTEPGLAFGPQGQRATATLELFGHRVEGTGAPAAALVAADVVEIWGEVSPGPAGPGPDPLTHLVRPGRAPAFGSPGQRVLHLEPDLDDARADLLLDDLLAGGPVAVW